MALSDYGLIGLLAATVASGVLRWRSEARYARHAADQRAMMQDVGRVLRVLIVWAETWGQPPDAVRPLLHEALDIKT